MAVLRIEHPVPSYETWKQAFDGDPVGRQRSGVRRYRIMRPVDDPNYVLIDLEFDTPREAEDLLASMRAVWERVSGSVMSDPRARIVEAMEVKEY
jgi:ribosomal protein L35AE/L33A